MAGFFIMSGIPRGRDHYLEKIRQTHGNEYEYIDIPEDVGHETTIHVVCSSGTIFSWNAHDNRLGWAINPLDLKRLSRRGYELEYHEDLSSMFLKVILNPKLG